ncbi:MAG TPA: type II toxin-antitoxin system Phd/YefM family antitoxin [Thermoanaerobaculia bacterium]|nr:type II toxin-antitoxin system Phd/YefM family antitoxin [Thermoanaerobaculia bacterium]
MRETVSVADAKSRFAEYVRRAETGEFVVLSRHGKAVAALVSAGDVDQLERLRAAGPEKGLVSLAGGWKGSEELADLLAGRKRTRSRKVASLD